MKFVKWFGTLSKNSPAGFTLIEVCIGLLVFTIGILATASMQISAINGNALARSQTEAAAIAVNLVEELKNQRFENVLGCTPASNGVYTLTCAVIEEDIIINTKTLRITVSWNHKGMPKNLNLDYAIADII